MGFSPDVPFWRPDPLGVLLEGKRQDVSTDGCVVLVRLLDRKRILKRDFKVRGGRLGEKGVGRSPDVIAHVVLHEEVSDGDVRAKKLLPAGDRLKDVIAVVQHELEFQATDRRASIAGAGHDITSRFESSPISLIAGRQTGKD